MNAEEFTDMHPLVNFLYFSYILVLTMITMNPYMLTISFVMSVLLSLLFCKTGLLKRNARIAVLILVFSVVVQPLFTHSGSTPLFYINDSPVCLENYIYGLAAAVLLIAAINWCGIMESFLDSEKWLYLFGRFSPRLALTFSMILRFIPLMRQRYKMIHEGQLGMGRCYESSVTAALRQRVKELSVLITWSLEAAMETAASMSSRGYGLKGRTSYHRYKLNKSDIFLIMLMSILFFIIAAVILSGGMRFYYLPVVWAGRMDGYFISALILFLLLSAMPAMKVCQKN